jgi:hypothetical protein
VISFLPTEDGKLKPIGQIYSSDGQCLAPTPSSPSMTGILDPSLESRRAPQGDLEWKAWNINTTKILQTGSGDPYRFCAN